jgi:1,4-alpha-glucan branching enzyme
MGMRASIGEKGRNMSVLPAEQIMGMGSIVHEGGVAFRVWAPHAEFVSVIGDFNKYDKQANPMTKEQEGYWVADLAEAKAGDEYRYFLKNGSFEVTRIDPYAREVTNSVGNAVVHDRAFDWQGDNFELPAINELVIYEMHVGTFGEGKDDAVRTFQAATEKLDYLKRLGINVVEIMPVSQFAGDRSWGYNPSNLFAVESNYGGTVALKEFVRAAHSKGIGVLMDVVYNHFGPSDLDLWQFDGWAENGKGGIYFYNDWRAETPWGETRPDYGRKEVRQFIRDHAMMWLEEFCMDGLRMDATVYMRTVKGPGDPGSDLPDGWSLTQWINGEIRERFPHKISIAEDLQDNDWLTKPVSEGGAGYTGQWCAQFVHPVRAVAIEVADENRSMAALGGAIVHRFNNDPFQRVIYSESHDEIANGKARVTHAIDAENSEGWHAQKRSTLAAAITFTSPGVPMIFQGQEFLSGGWFQDNAPLDWDQQKEYRGIVRLYRDLIGLRLNKQNNSRGLTGSNINLVYLDQAKDICAYHRWYEGGAGDDVFVIVNFANTWAEGISAPFPRPGLWKLRLNSDWSGYSESFGSEAQDATAQEGPDGFRASLKIPPYTALIYSQDPEKQEDGEERPREGNSHE